MPVICTKEKSKYEIITGRVLEKRRADSKISNQTLRTFSVKNTDTSTNSKFFIGTPIPNSTAKGSINWKNTSYNTIVSEDQKLYNIPKSAENQTTFHKIDLKKTITHDKKNKDDDTNRDSHQTSLSVVSGNEKLKELQELHKQLQKSYEPKPLFAPRRPTLESIKSAIEKAKQENERNKNVGTDDYKSVVSMTDASTSTEKIMRKKYKKNRSPKEVQPSTSSASPTNEVKIKNSKKIAVNIKLNKKVDKSPEKK